MQYKLIYTKNKPFDYLMYILKRIGKKLPNKNHLLLIKARSIINSKMSPHLLYISFVLIIFTLQLSYVDFIAYEMFDQHTVLQSTCLDAFPTLLQFQKQFKDLKNVKDYLSSSRNIVKRLNNRMAYFGNGKL